MDILVLAMYEEVYSTTLQCEGCESVLPRSVEQHGLEARAEVSEVSLLILKDKIRIKLRYSNCGFASS